MTEQPAPVSDAETFIESLSRLDTLAYEQQRRQAAKALGCRVSVLDQLVDGARARARWREIEHRLAPEPAPSAPAWMRA